MEDRIKFDISKVWICSLDLAEFPQLIISACNTISETSKNVKDVSLMLAFEKLKDQLGGMELLRLHIRMQDLTAQISEENTKRRALVGMIKKHAKNRLDTYDDLEATQAKALYNWTKGIAPDLPYYSRNKLTRYINIMLDDSQKNEVIEEAISHLGLNRDFDRLRIVNAKFESLKLENDLLYINKNLSTNEKKELRDKAYSALSNFLRYLHAGMELYGSEHYEDLYIALKKNLGGFHSALKMRRNKKSETISDEDVALLNDAPNDSISPTDSESAADKDNKPEISV